MSLVVREEHAIDPKVYFSHDQRIVIKETLCPGISDQELELFAHVCARCKLDPFLKQIYAIMRKEKQKDGSYKDKMTIQTSIDGLRLIADRSGKYIPGREATFKYDANGKLFQATSYIKKQAKDGSWHEVAASALFNEFKPSYSNNFWDRMPHVMLAKVAEAQALKRAFPAEMCGLLTDDEMEQADVKPLYTQQDAPKQVTQRITQAQADELADLARGCPKEDAEKAWARIQKLGFDSWESITPEVYANARKFLIEKATPLPTSMDEVAAQQEGE
ncbi:MAG: phage recombination protein Bet [Acetomicrobium sp.]|nr:phage recombination protein Bet [Acetomicrobium sp.]